MAIKLAATDQNSRDVGVNLGAYLREITFYRELRDRIIKVAKSFDVGGNGPVLLSLPTWTPGAYDLVYFGAVGQERWEGDVDGLAAEPAVGLFGQDAAPHLVPPVPVGTSGVAHRSR